MFFLQAVVFGSGAGTVLRIVALAAFVLLMPADAAAEDVSASPTPRQAEILNDLATHRPPGYSGSGIWMLSNWDSGPGLAELVPLPAGGGNAAAHFRRLEELYPLEKEMLARDPANTRGVQELLLAAESGGCRLIPDYYPEFDTVEAKQPDIIVLGSYRNALQKQAEKLEASGAIAEAERCRQAVILCGWHLANDRPSVLVYMTGIGFKLYGAREYEKFLRRTGRSAKADAAGRFAGDMVALLRLVTWKARVALNELEGFASLPAVVRIALEDAEVCWRKEAVVRLAMLRHGVYKLGQKHIERDPVFEKMARDALARVASDDPDPSTRRLAVWAAINIRPDESLEHRF